ncbi:flagellar basal body L-ring protein FlgH [candidate division KSB1 bacterium]|nr:flagellar basal body L-ring protein FlgH [candidate division KSB1 bacterium]
MQKILYTCAGILLVTAALYGQTDSTNQVYSLFTDQKSLNVGDILTIYIMEFSSGANQAATSSENKNDVGLDAKGTGSLSSFPTMGLDFGKSKGFDGKGSTMQKGNLTAKVSALITERVNANILRIEGKREVNVNGDKQTITLSGLVRVQDVSANNIVYSYNIADAQINYKGKGTASGAKKPWWPLRLFGWII